MVVSALWILGACGPQVMLDSGGGDGSDSSASGPTTSASTAPAATVPPSATTIPPSQTSTTGVDPDSTSPDDGFDDGCDEPCGCDFLGASCDVSSLVIECDVWTQDCPRGEKCLPWGNDGGPHYNATRCSPIDAMPAQVGESCIAKGAPLLSGIDSCDRGLLCAWADNTEGVGTCVAMCDGTADNPLCSDPDNACVIDYLGTVTLCLPRCDLLLQNCPVGQGACFSEPEAQSGTCGILAYDLSVVFEPCVYDWDCTPGTVCHPADELSDCSGASCCTPICDTTSPDNLCLEDEACLAFVTQGPPQPYTEGYCALP